MATTNTRVTEETKLRQEIAKAKREYEKIKQRNRNFNVDLDEEEAAAKEAYENAQTNLETYQLERQESISEKGKENKIETLQTRILSEQTRLDRLKSPDREGGFLIPAATEDRVRNLEESIYKKEQEVLSLGGELRTPTKFDLFVPPETTPTPSANIADKARTSQRLRDLYGDNRQVSSNPMADLLGGGRLKNLARIPLEPSLVQSIERASDGTFNIDGVKNVFIYDRSNNVLNPVPIDAFKNNLYRYTPAQIAEFKKGLGYKAEDINGVLTDKFQEDMLDLAIAVSERDFGYSVTGTKEAIGIEGYLLNPESNQEIQSILKQQKSGTGGGGTALDSARLAANVDTIRLLETQLGASLTKAQRNKIARDLATGRVNATTLPSTIARAGNIMLEEGEAASTKAAIKELAAANGVDMGLGEAWFDNAAKRILEGRTTLDTINNEILNQAKMKYGAPSVVAGLDAGFSVRDQAAQYINWIAQVRGVDAKSVSLDDPIISRAFTNRNDEGMPVQMSLYDWQNWAKENDPSYAYSSMAEESYMSTLRAIGKAFGKSI